MEAVAYFHFAIMGACLTYFFKLSEVKLEFFEECYRAFRSIVSQMTGEISRELESLSTPMPTLIVPTTDQVEYREGNSSPWKSEKFKNWMDSYLDKNLSAIMSYHQITLLYRKWSHCWSFLKKASLYYAIFELLAGVFSFYSAYSIKSLDASSKLISDEASFRILVSVAVVSIVLLISVLLLLLHTENLKSDLIKLRDRHNDI